MYIIFQVLNLKIFNILFNFLVSSRRSLFYNPSFILFLILKHTMEHYVFLYNIFFYGLYINKYFIKILNRF